MEELNPPCKKCGLLNGVHSMNCATLQLPANWAEMTPAERYGNPE